MSLFPKYIPIGYFPSNADNVVCFCERDGRNAHFVPFLRSKHNHDPMREGISLRPYFIIKAVYSGGCAARIVNAKTNHYPPRPFGTCWDILGSPAIHREIGTIQSTYVKCGRLSLQSHNVGAVTRGLGGRLVMFSLFLNGFQSAQRSPNATHADENQEPSWKVCARKKTAEFTIRLACGIYGLLFGCVAIYTEPVKAGFLRRIVGPALLFLGVAAFLLPRYYTDDCENKSNPPPFLNPLPHGDNTVPRKYLVKLGHSRKGGVHKSVEARSFAAQKMLRSG